MASIVQYALIHILIIGKQVFYINEHASFTL